MSLAPVVSRLWEYLHFCKNRYELPEKKSSVIQTIIQDDHAQYTHCVCEMFPLFVVVRDSERALSMGCY